MSLYALCLAALLSLSVPLSARLIENQDSGPVIHFVHGHWFDGTGFIDTAPVRLADADIALAAGHHVQVQATAGIDVDEHTLPADVAARKLSQVDNLRRLKAAGVIVLVGSDR